MVSVTRSGRHGAARPVGCGRLRARDHRRRARTPVAPRPTPLRLSFVPRRGKRSAGNDWLAGAAMLLAAAGWGVLAALLGS